MLDQGTQYELKDGNSVLTPTKRVFMQIFRLKIFTFLLTFSFVLRLNLVLWANPGEEAGKLRSFLVQVIKISQSAPADIPVHFRQVLADNPTLFALWGDGKSLDKIFKEAELAFLETDNISSNQWVETFFLPVQKQSEQMPQIVWDLKKRWMNKSAASDESKSLLALETALEKGGRAVSTVFSKLPHSIRLKLLGYIDDAVFVNVCQTINNTIRDYRFSDSDKLKRLIEKAFHISDSENGNPFDLGKIFMNYFDFLSYEKKTNILVSILNLPPGATAVEQFSATVHETGPAFQKLLQLSGQESPSEEMRQVLKALLSNVKPFPGQVAQEIVERAYGLPIHKLFAEFSLKPLAAATVGQVHLAKLIGTHEEVVVKIQRPHITQYLLDEIVILKQLSDEPAWLNTISIMEQSLHQELDYLKEAENIARGEIYNRPELGFNVARMVPNFPAQKNVLVLKKAPGIPIIKLAPEENLLVRGQAISNLLKLWFDEAIFQSGFFHSDLHMGNIFFLEQKNKIPPYLLTIIDFGNSGSLSVQQRRAIIELLFACTLKDSETAFASLEKLQGQVMSATAAQGLKKEIVRILASSENMNIAVAEIFHASLRSGIKIPRGVLEFNRGRIFLEFELERINKMLGKQFPKLGANHFKIVEMYAKLLIKRGGSDLVKELFGKKSEEELIITRETIYKLLKNGISNWINNIKKYCSSPIRSLIKIKAISAKNNSN